eukprot:839718-Amphidinium_carterae.1
MRIKSYPMDRSPSARLQPPGLQLLTRGPGCLASPILATGSPGLARKDPTGVWSLSLPLQGAWTVTGKLERCGGNSIPLLEEAGVPAPQEALCTEDRCCSCRTAS